ncbi:Cytochrome c oxidase subunit 7A [Blattella germanica]|nr:Cytochrome c oxidase subunit 7A [Blattella germanica]
MNCGKKVLQLGFSGARQITTSQVARQQTANYEKLKAKQAKFQVNNGLGVHEKGGIVDKILYQVTLAMCVVGMGLSGKVLYDLSFPKHD